MKEVATVDPHGHFWESIAVNPASSTQPVVWSATPLSSPHTTWTRSLRVVIWMLLLVI